MTIGTVFKTHQRTIAFCGLVVALELYFWQFWRTDALGDDLAKLVLFGLKDFLIACFATVLCQAVLILLSGKNFKDFDDPKAVLMAAVLASMWIPSIAQNNHRESIAEVAQCVRDQRWESAGLRAAEVHVVQWCEEDRISRNSSDGERDF